MPDCYREGGSGYRESLLAVVVRLTSAIASDTFYITQIQVLMTMLPFDWHRYRRTVMSFQRVS